jgi:hypothetical protein
MSKSDVYSSAFAAILMACVIIAAIMLTIKLGLVLFS